MYIMGTEPCPNVTAEEFQRNHSPITSERELADAYAISSNQFWWVEDNVYDYEEGTPEHQKACAIVDAWNAVMAEYERKIFAILEHEGISVPDSGRITILIPFMKRNGYTDEAGWWVKKNDPQDYIQAHEFCHNHMKRLQRDRVCGCFFCLEIFHPSEITEWIIEDNACDRFGTAICPYCGIDSVIGESSGYPITKNFLKMMQHHWFGASSDADPHEEK